MIRNVPFTQRRQRSLVLNRVSFLVLAGLAALLYWTYGCRETLPDDPASQVLDGVQDARADGEAFLLGAMEEIDRIAEFSLQSAAVHVGGYDELARALPGAGEKRLLAAETADTTYIYGEITPGGYGAVVTERHTYPKGLPLITVRRSYGKPLSHVVTETKRYITEAGFLADSAEQSTITELYGLSADTIVTHVVRNGILETYTFRLPVVTRVTSPTDGSVRVTTRYGDAGAIVSEVRNGANVLQLLRRTSGDPDGAIVNYTFYPDSSWRNTRTIGEADGSVLREITSGP